MARKTNDLDKSSKNEIDSKKIHTKLETEKIPASVKTIIKNAEKNIKKLGKTSKKVSAPSSKAEKNKVPDKNAGFLLTGRHEDGIFRHADKKT